MSSSKSENLPLK